MPHQTFGFVGPTYSSAAITADAQRCMNLFVEVIESGSGKSPAMLTHTPGLKQFNDPASEAMAPPQRGMITVNGRFFTVGGPFLYEISVNPLTGVKTQTTLNPLLPMSNDQKPVSMAASNAQLLIASSGVLYWMDLTTLVSPTFAAVDMTNFSGKTVSQVAYSDAYFIALLANSQSFQISHLSDVTTWDALDIAEVSEFPENVVSMIVVNRDLVFLGENKSIVYFNSGDADFPFNPISGAFLEIGCAAALSTVRLDNSLFWIGKDERGQAMAWRATGYSTAQRVSNHAVEASWQTYSTISDAIAYSYQENGHAFWNINFPTADKTWVLDVSTGMWHERGFWDEVKAVFRRSRAQYHAFFSGKHLVGDWNTGNIFEMSTQFYDDFGVPIRRIRRAPHVAKQNDWVYHRSLRIDMETGTSPFLAGKLGRGVQSLVMQDSSGALWKVSVNDLGSPQTQSITTGLPTTLFLNDKGSSTSWQLLIDTTGRLGDLSQVEFEPSTPYVLPFLTSPSKSQVFFYVNNGRLERSDVTTPIQQSREPLVSVRWSNDAGRTWSSERLVESGRAGEYTRRAIVRRLGRARDRIYEVAISDPIPVRIIEAYLDADASDA